MYISKVRIHNYKSYHDSGWIDLAPGFNVITGQNNAGKTALLEGLGLRLNPTPHRSLTTKPTVATPLDHVSSVDMRVNLSADELWDLLTYRGKRFHLKISLPQRTSEFAREIGAESVDDVAATAFLEWLFSREVYELDLRFEKKDPNKGTWDTLEPDMSCFGIPIEPAVQMVLNIDPFNKQIEFHHGETGKSKDDFGVAIADLIEERIYSFKAERFGYGRCQRGRSRILKSDASNLAEVLHNLQSNGLLFKRYTDLVREVLPQVQQIAVRSSPGYEPDNHVEVHIWTDNTALERDDLSFSLEECGTGVGQVLAILYVVFTSERHPRVIVIDEPQSFLHPGAVRKLIDILKQNSEHQYIISTNTPSVITAADLSTVTLVKQTGAQSTIESLDVNKTENQLLWLDEVGARLSDVFGLDRVLWVEGKTEELCFRRIVEKLMQHPLMGVAIVGVLNTGDLEGRDARRVREIYTRLTQSGGLIPPAVGFILDREGRTQTEREDLERINRLKETGHIFFLNRRLYENYLLNAQAITSVVNSIEGFRDTPVSVEEIDGWIEANRDNKKYKNPLVRQERIKPSSWLETVDGASLLYDLFAHMSGTKVHYDKVEHSVALTEWLIGNDPDSLGELVDLLRKVLGAPRENA
jgi:predicted ATPase